MQINVKVFKNEEEKGLRITKKNGCKVLEKVNNLVDPGHELWMIFIRIMVCCALISISFTNFFTFVTDSLISHFSLDVFY